MQRFLNEDGMANMEDTEIVVKDIERISGVKIDVVHVHGKLYNNDLNKGYRIECLDVPYNKNCIITDGVVQFISEDDANSDVIFNLCSATYLVYLEKSKIHLCFAPKGTKKSMERIIKALRDLKYIIDGE